MTDTEKTLLDAINEMAEQAPSVGLCSTPFRMIHAQVWEIVKERDELLKYRTPRAIKGWSCPSCGNMIDPFDDYCANCGQRLTYKGGE